MAVIKVLVGSTYGNAAQLADGCIDQLVRLGHQAKVATKLEEVLAKDTEVLLVCCASIGQGEIPENLLPLYCAMKDKCPPLPDVGYAVIAVGDSSYISYAEGARQMMALMEELNCRKLQDPLYIDACETDDPEAEVEAWTAALHRVI